MVATVEVQLSDAYSPNVTAVVDAYATYFGPVAETLPLRLQAPADNDIAIVVYLPEDPESTTQLGTAGLSAYPIADGFRAEVAIELKGSVDAGIRRELADALVALAAAPLKIGRPFLMNQTLGNVRLPMFEKFRYAMLVDWDPVYGFIFPNLPEPVTLLQVVPLFESEAAHIESLPDRRKGYLDLISGGLEPEDYDRGPVA